MSPKVILITFAVVSLLLIGIMFLVVDVRNNPLEDNQRITNTIEENKKQQNAFVDSLEALGTKKPKEFTPVEALHTVTEDLLSQIKGLQERLFPSGLAAHDLQQSDRSVENNTVFFKKNGDYTEQATRFVATLSTLENTIRSLQNIYPALKNIKALVRNAYSGDTDWLNYNFKDFPAVASHSKLQLLAEAIKNKKEEIITTLLRN